MNMKVEESAVLGSILCHDSEGVEAEPVARIGAGECLRTIVLSTLTAALGMLPAALGLARVLLPGRDWRW